MRFCGLQGHIEHILVVLDLSRVGHGLKVLLLTVAKGVVLGSRGGKHHAATDIDRLARVALNILTCCAHGRMATVHCLGFCSSHFSARHSATLRFLQFLHLCCELFVPLDSMLNVEFIRNLHESFSWRALAPLLLLHQVVTAALSFFGRVNILQVLRHLFLGLSLLEYIFLNLF